MRSPTLIAEIDPRIYESSDRFSPPAPLLLPPFLPRSVSLSPVQASSRPSPVAELIAAAAIVSRCVIFHELDVRNH